ncbi:WD40 repeat-like protein [Coniophora puteana RWD-64-598 SS2]|uniref:WD40 repeat-like protein n=1 Tax=Coniophora puteana (strain RWD-64-598) TaxID=741705 RepID=A0A5M3MGE9_CONPW|nr:WD40 repeat-like protein [Coniophora puteana RWD-64-598 SS2]EIW77695.1 WD40 repeat-like protein [Coniophora puteana RWD-64-598 SS2]
MAPRRRISYIIPPPTDPVPLLRLPPPGTHHAGSSQPLLIPASSSSRRQANGHSPHEHEHAHHHGHHSHHHHHHHNSHNHLPSLEDASQGATGTRGAGGDDQADVQHPRHRLGVMALALDTTTALEGSDGPEGILYTGGRDGMVVAWDLGLPLRKRSQLSAAPWTLDAQPASPIRSATTHAHAGASEHGAKRRRKDRWEVLTGMAEEGDGVDDGSEEEDGHARYQSGDVLGDVKESWRWRGRGADGTHGRRRAKTMGDLSMNGGELERAGEEGQWEEDVPWEARWELDGGQLQDGTPSRFRMSAQTHTDWVNDIVLCNYNQTVVSASSDGTVKAWNPHSSTPQDPVTLGAHADYARCLAVCREQNWVASGSFDRTIKLWDLTRSAPSHSAQSPTSPSASSSPRHAYATSTSTSTSTSTPTPLLTLNPPDASSPKSSVYALGCDPYGHVIASGSPERVVRLWDPRSGKRTGKLVGHTDNIRAVVVSEDGRYLLTGSADASIKLWSLASQRCLHTFAHHADSVWALHSTHPALERFVSGDRSGIVCLVDVRAAQSDMAEGTACVVCIDAGGCPPLGSEGGARAVSPSGGQSLLSGGGGVQIQVQVQESTGINALLMLDDGLLWTASGGSSSVKRWRVPVPDEPESEGGAGGVSARAMSHERERTVTSGSAGLSGRKRSGSGGVVQGMGYGEDDWDPRNILGGSRHRSPSPQPFALSSQPLPTQPYAHVPLTHQIQLASPMATSSSAFLHHTHAASRFGRDSDVATLYSAASVVSVPGTGVQRSLGFGHGHMYTAHTPPVSSGLPPVNELNSRSPRHSFSPSLFASQSGAFDLLGGGINGGGGMAALASAAQPYAAQPDLTIGGSAGLVRAVLLNNRMHALTVDTGGEVACWDVVRGTCVGRWAVADVRAAWAAKQQHQGGGGQNGDMTHIASESTIAIGMGVELETSPRDALEVVRERIEGEASVPVWGKIDTKTGALNVHLEDGGRCFDAEVYADEAGYSGAKGEEVRYNIGKWVLRNLFLGFIREEQRSRRKHREHDAPRSAGPASPAASSLSLQIPPGQLGPRRVSSDASMQSHLQSPTPGYVSGAATPTFMPAHQAHARSGPSGSGTLSGTVTTSPNARAPIPPAIPRQSNRMAGPLLTPMIPIAALKGAGPGMGLTTIPQSPSPGEPTPTPMGIAIPPMTTPTAGGGPGTPGAAITTGANAVTTNATPGPAGAQPVTTDYFSTRTRRPSTASNGLPPLTTNTTGGSGGNSSSTSAPGTNPTANVSADDFSAWGGPGSPSASGGGQPPQTPTTPSAGLRGLLKNFTKTGKKAADVPLPSGSGAGVGNGTGATAPGSPVVGKEREKEGEDAPEVKSPLQTLLSSSFSPPSSSEVPTLQLPQGLSVLISDEVYCGWQTVYRGAVSGTWADVSTLEETLPLWVLEYLLHNRIHTQPAVKLSFVLLPWASGESGEKALPELLNSAQSKLTASRLLRVRKLTHHVQDKLDKLSGSSGTPTSATTPDSIPPMSPTPSMISVNATTSARQNRHRAEEMYEILCNDIVLPLDMTLATVRQYYWRQMGELIMHYRLKARDARPSVDNLTV